MNIDIEKVFKDAIDSPSYIIVRDVVLEHLDEYRDGRWKNQKEIAEFIIDNYEDITVKDSTVGVYVSDVLKRIDNEIYKKLKDSGNLVEEDNGYEVEELKQALDYDEFSCMVMSGVLTHRGDKKAMEEIIDINRERLGEERYKKLKALDFDRLKYGYVYDRDGRKIKNIKAINKALRV